MRLHTFVELEPQCTVDQFIDLISSLVVCLCGAVTESVGALVSDSCGQSIVGPYLVVKVRTCCVQSGARRVSVLAVLRRGSLTYSILCCCIERDSREPWVLVVTQNKTTYFARPRTTGGLRAR